MCILHAFGKRKDKSTGSKHFHGGHPLPEDSKLNTLIYLCVTINALTLGLIYWKKTITLCCLAYQDKTKEIFQKNPTEVFKNIE